MRSKKGKSIEQRLEELTKNEVGYSNFVKSRHSYVTLVIGSFWLIKIWWLVIDILMILKKLEKLTVLLVFPYKFFITFFIADVAITMFFDAYTVRYDDNTNFV